MSDRSDQKPAAAEGLELHPVHTRRPPEPPLSLPPELVGKSEEEIWAWAHATGRNPRPVVALQIETSSICNFRCESCPLSLPGYDRPQQHLCPAEFEKILDAFPYVAKVELQGLGEVFLNPDLERLIAVAAARGIEVHTYSNASKVTPQAAFAVVGAGLSLINFSMDGADAETFRTLRKGGRLEVYKRSVQNLLDARRALGRETPRVGVMTVLSKRNLDQLPKLIAIAEELGVDGMTLTKLNGSHVEGQAQYELDDADRDYLRSLPPYEGPLQLHWAFETWSKEDRMGCYWPQHMAYVTVEGHVTPCCNYADSRELSMGSIHDQSGEQIWNDDAYREFRKRLFAGDLPHKCRIC